MQEHTVVRQTPEKVIPPILEYNAEGGVRLIGLPEILDEYEPSPYYPGSPQFPIERVDNVQVDKLYQHLESFPNIGYSVVNGKREINPFSELIYSTLVMMRPNESVLEALKEMNFLEQMNTKSILFNRACRGYERLSGKKLDPYSVPKRRVGQVVFQAADDGIAAISKVISFGLHKVFPTDRICREVSSLHNCERYISPRRVPSKFVEISPYWTIAKVLVLHTDTPLLDSAYITEIGQKSLACRIERLKYETDLKKVDRDNWNLDFVANKASIEIVHVEHEVYDESVNQMGTIRLVMPGGVKFAAGPDWSPHYNCSEPDVDVVMDFRTLAAKGAVGLFWWDDPSKIGKITEQDVVHNHARRALSQPETVFWNGRWYRGHVLYIPVARPGQRYQDICKPCNVTFDLVSHAILNQEVRVPQAIAQEYKELREFAKILEDRLSKV